MTAGGAAVRKPTSSRESALAAMRSTLADFRSQASSWQREVEQLFDDFESLGLQTVLQSSAAGGSNHPRTEGQFVELAVQQQELVRQQQVANSEIAALRQIVERQTELFTSLLRNDGSCAEAGNKVVQTSHDPVVDAVHAQFEQLQRQASAGTSSP